MAFCSKCGTQVTDDSRFCPSCGNPMDAASENSFKQAGDKAKEHIDSALNQFQNAKDWSSQFSQDDINRNKGMAVLAYFGPLVLIPIFAVKDSPFARYHANQGLVLFIIEVIYGIVTKIVGNIFSSIWWGLGSIFDIVFALFGLVFVVYMIFGIVNAVGGNAKELPIIGRFKLL